MNSLDYYIFLLKISWPAVSGLFAVYFFLGIRLYLAFRKYNTGKSSSQRFTVGSRLTLTLVVLIIYTQMFAGSFADWFHYPSEYRGIVVDLPVNGQSSSSEYFVTLQNGKDILTVDIDNKTFKRLHKDDYVQISYLPIKKEVFRCIVLTQQAADRYHIIKYD